MEYTKFVDRLPLSTDNLYQMFKSKIFDSILESELGGFRKEIEQHIGLIRNYLAKYEWLPMRIGSTSKLVLYNTKSSVLIPDLLTFRFDTHRKMPDDYDLGFYNFPAKLFERELLETISFSAIENVYMLNVEYSKKKKAGGNFVDLVHETNPTFHNYLAYSDESSATTSTFGSGIMVYDIRNKNFVSGRIRADFTVMPIAVISAATPAAKLRSFRDLKLSVNPYGGEFEDLKTAFDRMGEFLAADLITDDFHINFDKISTDLREKGSLSEFNISYSTITKQGTRASVINTLDAEATSKPLLEVEHIRADIDPYDQNILTDPNRGHWDLWNTDEAKDCPVLELSSMGFVARNPKADINRNRVVAIDFGTKSTVVVFQDEDSKILPMRVGTGNISKSIQAKHYENPTVIEFHDLKQFMDAYAASKGRPATHWEDVCISHKAVDDLQSSCSTDYGAFLSGLKQWAGDTGVKRAIRMRDRTNRDFLLQQYRELSESDLDPIELYAYYLGLYINNMRNGIFLNYYLSFPVTYEIAVRDRIIQSFQRGIKKSLPRPILDDEEIMGKFRINGGISEPAAYAVCALQEYGFDPEESGQVFYSVFDFGGGTTDFDFGVWRESKSAKYDYTIEHFGASGDRYLGGENILAELAFYVFRANEEKLREERISFTRPPMCPDFAGSETLISDSREGRVNMRNLTERLRPIWENTDEEVIDQSGAVKVNLFRNDGTEAVGLSLNADKEKLNQLIYQRIEKGIESFFTSLKTAYGNHSLDKIEKIYIILAGNSSKSQYVESIFREKISYYTKEIKGEEDNPSMFELLPPIGTEEFFERRAQINPAAANRIDKRGEFERPTGKTGVAFGLIECRRGGRIEIIANDEADGESPFKYYIGTRKRRFFRILNEGENPSKIPGRLDYERWYEVFESDDYTIEIYCTTKPEAVTNTMPIESAKKLMLSTDAKNDPVFIRAIDPHTLEYVSALSLEDAEEGNYIGTIHQVSLE